MGKRSTFAGYIRQRGMANPSGNGKGTPGTFKCYVTVSFDSAQAVAGTGVYLPAGAIVYGVTAVASDVTGGTAPTVDIQLAGGTAGGLLDNADATATAAESTSGADFLTALTADTEIEAGAGTGTPGTGTYTALVSYLIADDGVINN